MTRAETQWRRGMFNHPLRPATTRQAGVRGDTEMKTTRAEAQRRTICRIIVAGIGGGNPTNLLPFPPCLRVSVVQSLPLSASAPQRENSSPLP